MNFFYLFIFYFFIFNSLAIISNGLSSFNNFYLLTVFILLILSFYTVGRTGTFILKVESLTQNLNIKKLCCFYFLVMVIFFMTNDNSLSDVFVTNSNLIDHYKHRLKGLNTPFYFLYEIVANLSYVICIIFLLRNNYLMLCLVFFTYFLFYSYTVQKSPIATLFFSLLFFYITNYKVPKRFYFISLACVFGILFYFYSLIFNTFNINNIYPFLNALTERVLVAGDIVTWSYSYFDTAPLLYGATLPKFLGLFDLNVMGHSPIRLPSFIMTLRSGNEGGANATFIVEGFANLGYGGDVLFILFLILYLYLLFKFSSGLNDFYRNIYMFTCSYMIIDLVHIDMWGFLTKSTILLLIIYFVFCLEKIIIKR